jgi:mxaK protein
VPLIELAKETYREVLRHDPGHWSARYNLERAQRLLPDPEDDGEGPPAPPNQAERSATTMRGYSPGLP